MSKFHYLRITNNHQLLRSTQQILINIVIQIIIKYSIIRRTVSLVGDVNRTFVIGGNEAENIVMPQHHCLIYFCFSEPRALLSRAEYLDSYVLTPPASTPYLAKSPFADCLDELNLAGYTPLYQERQTYLMYKMFQERANVNITIFPFLLCIKTHKCLSHFRSILLLSFKN